MSIRLVVTIKALPGKGDELARAFRERCPEVRKEPGCEHYEAFQSASDPDTLVMLERWTDQAALDLHAKVMAEAGGPVRGDLRAGPAQREDYVYNRTR